MLSASCFIEADSFSVRRCWCGSCALHQQCVSSPSVLLVSVSPLPLCSMPMCVCLGPGRVLRAIRLAARMRFGLSQDVQRFLSEPQAAEAIRRLDKVSLLPAHPWLSTRAFGAGRSKRMLQPDPREPTPLATGVPLVSSRAPPRLTNGAPVEHLGSTSGACVPATCSWT